MKGDVGPYVALNDEDIWVPRTVPYLEARRIAREAIDYDDRLEYIGKADATLTGFALDCRCDEICERRWLDDEDTDDRSCEVPAWHFRAAE